jgi:alkanesulfonate monooxygenase SsuD/methylene tetrahydromethanopterin reductase-like flavin-dependent oxidoreductase (luciferase family)
MQIGMCFIPSSMGLTDRVAQEAEGGGIGWFGISDTPFLYAESHACLQSAARVTSTMRIGTFVTNPVTRHWSVQAGGFRSIDEVADGRLFLGIGPGDSAVHTAGLKPASPSQLRHYVAAFRASAPASIDVMVTAGGPVSVERAASYADHLVLGQGASSDAVDELGALIDRSGGRPKRWIFMLLGLVEHESDIPEMKRQIRAPVMGYSRQAFDRTFERKGVPVETQGRLIDLYRRYDFNEHSVVGDSANARLLAGEPALEEYLFDRFALVGTPEQVGERLEMVSEQTGIDSIFLSAICADPLLLMKLAATRLMPRLNLTGNAG